MSEEIEPSPLAKAYRAARLSAGKSAVATLLKGFSHDGSLAEVPTSKAAECQRALEKLAAEGTFLSAAASSRPQTISDLHDAAYARWNSAKRADH